MGHLLTSGQVGNIGLNHMKAIRKMTQEKWESLGFLEKNHPGSIGRNLFVKEFSRVFTG